MPREYSRTQRVGDFLQQELAQLIQHSLRDPRIGMVNITGVDVTRDLSYAKVFYTRLGVDSADEAKEITEVLNGAAGFLRSEIARSANMRTVPRLSFRFDESVGRGRDMEALFKEVRAADAKLNTGDASGDDTDA
ncbi:MAG: 30S ribosome-binding factor RbfA [Halieaceae bacterium]|jgi:ribosome-binding factor A|nr:30S ribosome-binding factor RbfA [Halieaceae bacterium]